MESVLSVLPVRRAAAAVVALGMLCSISPRVAAGELSFEASGEFTVTFVQGRVVEAVLSGTARPWGGFTATATEFAMGVSGGVGTATYQFGAGSLTLAYDTVNVGDGFAGTWFVLDGTGIFADATGSGDLFLAFTGPGSTRLGAGVVDLAGTISL